MMKKKYTIITTSIILIITIFNGCTENQNNNHINNNQNSSNTLYVDINNTLGPWIGTQQKPYRNIQDAIDNIKNKTEIKVAKGIYNENIIINTSPIKLLGDNAKTTIISSKTTNDTIYIDAENITIKGFTIKKDSNENIQYGNSGIDIKASNTTITDCILEGNKYGIHLDHTHNCTINSSEFNNNQYGIYTYFAFYNNISNNILSSNQIYGIYLSSRSNENIISDNIISGSSYACRIKSSYYNIVTNNLFLNNQEGVYLCCSSKDNQIYLNRFHESALWHAKDDIPKQNYWYNETEGKGNYWDDYQGEDNDNDGIGDTPYEFEVNATDPYPLI